MNQICEHEEEIIYKETRKIEQKARKLEFL